MKIKNLLLLSILVGMGFVTKAQTVKSILLPIEVRKKFLGVNFIYDRQTIENPLALQIPIVNVAFLTYKQQRKMVQLINIVPAGVSLYTIFNREKVSSGFYWSTVGTTLLISSYLNIKSNAHLSKAINRYNALFTDNKVGMNLERIGSNELAIGVQFTHSF
jgi:hypothetical protein